MPKVDLSTARLKDIKGLKYTRIEFKFEGERTYQRISTKFKPSERRQADQYFADWKLTQAKKQKEHICIADVLDAYYNEKEQTIVNPRSLLAHVDRLKLSDFANLLPDQFTRQHSKDYRVRRLKEKTQHGTPVKDGTVAKELGVLRAAVRLITGTILTIEMPPSQPPRIYYLTEDEVARLLAAAEEVGNHIYLFILLAYTTAARRGAILDLTWDRVDKNGNGYIQYSDGKSHLTKGRATVPITDANRDALETTRRGATTNHVIEFRGHRIYDIKNSFNAARERAGLPEWVTPHVLRHTAITHMRAAGVGWDDIAEVAGHTTPAVTRKTYGHVLPDTHAAVGVLKVKRADQSTKNAIDGSTTPLAGRDRSSIVPRKRSQEYK